MRSPVFDFESIVRISVQAGQAIMPYFASNLTVSLKSDNSPVTVADQAAHHVIEQALQPLGYPVVSEEGHNRDGGACYWLVDPLDGTRSFIDGSTEFTVNIAWIDQGRPVWGVVHAPALNRTWWGGVDHDSQMQSEQGVQTIQVSPSRHPLRVLASKNHSNPATQAFLEQLGQIEHIASGSSLKFCEIAQGQADLYPRLGPCCEWDTAAGEAVLMGAGGQVCDFQGQPLRYGKSDVLNPHFIASGQRDPRDYLP